MLRNRPITRRSALMSFGAFGLATAARPSMAVAQQAPPGAGPTDFDIFNFALNLESLETEYYLRGTTGKGMDAADAGTSPGPVTGGRMVPWKNDDLKEFMEEVAANELAHVRFTDGHLEARRCHGPRSTSPHSPRRPRLPGSATISTRSPAR